MNTATKLGVYALGLAVAFSAALGVGRLAGPVAAPVPHEAAGGHGDAGHSQTGGPGTAVPGGLQVADAGYRLAPVTTTLSVGASTEFAFRILGPDGAAVTRYAPTHERDLHLIVVRRDLAGFQHVHPALGADGTWRIPLGVAGAGQYRVFADFQPVGRDKALTLGVDVPAAGTYDPRPLPAAARIAEVDGYRVEVTGDLKPGTASKVTLKVTRDGQPVTDLQPYLGAYGHLVALRDGDLAYLHVHPDGEPGDGRTAAGPEVTFYAQVPSVGSYRLFLDFQHQGRVRTAEFTVNADGEPAPASSPTGPVPAASTASNSAPAETDPHTHG
jgi:hypothetical protein